MPNPKTAGPTQWLTVKEAAAYARCSAQVISRAAFKNQLSGVKLDPGNVRSKWLFTTKDIDTWLERGRIPARRAS